jgi:hypothetical protein
VDIMEIFEVEWSLGDKRVDFPLVVSWFYFLS